MRLRRGRGGIPEVQRKRRDAWKHYPTTIFAAGHKAEVRQLEREAGRAPEGGAVQPARRLLHDAAGAASHRFSP